MGIVFGGHFSEFGGGLLVSSERGKRDLFLDDLDLDDLDLDGFVVDDFV